MIKVSVALVSYNHRQYIRKAIESILAQKSNFAFEIVVGDDCSSDGTREILEDYREGHPDTIRILDSPKNIGALANFKKTLAACRGEYVALCEGDDFWADALKLEKQTDFLDHNLDYGMVHTDFNFLFEQEQRSLSSYNTVRHENIPKGKIFEELLFSSKHLIKTCTVMVRKSIVNFDDFFDFLMKKNWLLGDQALWLEYALKSKIGYLPDATGTYRLLKNSASRHSDLMKHYLFHQSVHEIKYFYWVNYSQRKSEGKKLNSMFLNTAIGDAFKMNDFPLARESMCQARTGRVSISFKQWLKYFYLWAFASK